jgi:hypothetical protein
MTSLCTQSPSLLPRLRPQVELAINLSVGWRARRLGQPEGAAASCMDGSSSSFKVRAAGVPFRPHDMSHTFISLLTENANVSEQTIRPLRGMSVRCSNATATSVRKRNRQRFRRSNDCLWSQFCRRPGAILGTLSKWVGVGRQPPRGQRERVWVREIFPNFELLVGVGISDFMACCGVSL